MKKLNYPYSGFFLSWHFYDKKYKNWETLSNPLLEQKVLLDIKTILTICIKYELLFPTYILIESEKVFFKSLDLDSVVEEIIDKFNKKVVKIEILKIGGYGYVYLPNGEKGIQEDLIEFADIRFFDRSMSIVTSKSLWVPISIDTDYTFSWQIEIAELNSVRLEKCLEEIQDSLKVDVEPSKGEVNQDYPIWRKGFKMFVSSSLLMREYRDSPPANNVFDIKKHLI